MSANTEANEPPTSIASEQLSRQAGTHASDAATSAEVGDYIADLLQGLRELSSASGQTRLSLLLEMAQREARHLRRDNTGTVVGSAPP